MVSKFHNVLQNGFPNTIDNYATNPDCYFILYNGLNDYTVVLLNDYNE